MSFFSTHYMLHVVWMEGKSFGIDFAQVSVRRKTSRFLRSTIGAFQREMSQLLKEGTIARQRSHARPLKWHLPPLPFLVWIDEHALQERGSAPTAAGYAVLIVRTGFVSESSRNRLSPPECGVIRKEGSSRLAASGFRGKRQSFSLEYEYSMPKPPNPRPSLPGSVGIDFVECMIHEKYARGSFRTHEGDAIPLQGIRE